MRVLTLKRIYSDSTQTFGVLLDEKKPPFCVTVERPWRNNTPNESCIPVGEYTCKRKWSEHFGETFEVTGVVGRTDVLIHKGNFSTDSKGCIILGENFAVINDSDGVGSSGIAFAEFMARMKGLNEFKLVVVNV